MLFFFENLTLSMFSRFVVLPIHKKKAPVYSKHRLCLHFEKGNLSMPFFSSIHDKASVSKNPSEPGKHTDLHTPTNTCTDRSWHILLDTITN